MPSERFSGVLHELPLKALDRKSTRLNSSHLVISYAVFCLKKKNDRPPGLGPSRRWRALASAQIHLDLGPPAVGRGCQWSDPGEFIQLVAAACSVAAEPFSA